MNESGVNESGVSESGVSESGLKLNLGCGHSRLDGWVNVDHFPGCNPDVVQNLESFPWPWPDNSVDQIYMSHVLEHLAADTSVFLRLMQEIYRVCRHNALLRVIVPHPRHDNFICDPTHVRAIIPGTLAMFSQVVNQEAIDNGWANTPLGIQTGVDLDLVNITIMLDKHWEERRRKGEFRDDEIEGLARQYNNVIDQFDMSIKIVKPGRVRPV